MRYQYADEEQTRVAIIRADSYREVTAAAFAVIFAEEPGGVPAIEPYEPPAAAGATVPESVSPWQAREALRLAGMLAAVNAHIETEGEDSAAYIAWHYAERVRRNSPFVESIGPALGLNAEAIDSLFITAAGLSL